MTTYSINVEDVELALLPPRTYQYNDFLKKELFEFQVMKKPVEDPPAIFYTCHICAIKVLAAFASEHAASVKHRANVRIASEAVRRTRLLIAALPPPVAELPNARFCVHCATVADKHHDLTKEHSMAVMHDEKLWELMKVYVNGYVNENEDDNTESETRNGDQAFGNSSSRENVGFDNIKENNYITNQNLVTDKRESTEEAEVCEATYLFIETTATQYIETSDKIEVENSLTTLKANEVVNCINNAKANSDYDNREAGLNKMDSINSDNKTINEANLFVETTSRQYVKPAGKTEVENSLTMMNDGKNGNPHEEEQNKIDYNANSDTKSTHEVKYMFESTHLQHDDDSTEFDKVNIEKKARTIQNSIINDNNNTMDNEIVKHVDKPNNSKSTSTNAIDDLIARKKALLPTTTRWHKIAIQRGFSNEQVNINMLVKKESLGEVKRDVTRQLHNQYAQAPYEEVLNKVIDFDISYLGIKELDGMMQIMKNNEIIHVPLDHFHSYLRMRHGSTDCIVCKSRFITEYAETHKYELEHMNNVANVGDNSNCMRKVTSFYSHCIICNIKVKKKNTTAHVLSSQHFRNKKIFAISKSGINEEPQFETGTKNVNEDQLHEDGIKKDDVSEITYPYEEAALGRVRCVICDGVMLRCNMKIHLQGSRHLRNVGQLTAADEAEKTSIIDSCSEENVLKGSDDETIEIDSSVITYPYKEVSPKHVYCMICGNFIKRKFGKMREHGNSLKHLKLSEQSAEVDTSTGNNGISFNGSGSNESIRKKASDLKVTNPFIVASRWRVYCTICDKLMSNNAITMEDHEQGARHLKNIKRTRMRTHNTTGKTNIIDGPEEQSTSKGIDSKTNENTNHSDSETEKIESIEGKLRCVTCDVTLLDINVVDHVNETRHKENIEKRQTEKKSKDDDNNTIKKVSEVSYPFEETWQGKVRCTICDIFVQNDVGSLIIHKKGLGHLREEFLKGKEAAKRWVTNK